MAGNRVNFEYLRVQPAQELPGCEGRDKWPEIHT